jgi:hypothetical protein
MTFLKSQNLKMKIPFHLKTVNEALFINYLKKWVINIMIQKKL